MSVSAHQEICGLKPNSFHVLIYYSASKNAPAPGFGTGF